MGRGCLVHVLEISMVEIVAMDLGTPSKGVIFWVVAWKYKK